MDNILLSSALAFLVTYFAIPVIIRVAKEKKFYDEPDERKVHKAVVPTLGGLGIFGGFVLAILIGIPPSLANQLQYFIASLLVIFFLGIKDDILVISPTKKFIGQIIAAGIIMKFGGIQINDMHGLFGINEIPHTASLLLTIFTIIVITNSFNLIDGVDGLAGSLGLLTSLIFGVYFWATGQLMYAIMAFALSASLIGFLIYNFSPAKIFMGDTGSLLIGLLNSIFVIKFIAVASDPSINNSFPLQSAPAIGFAILLVPLFDTLRVFGIRIFNRRSPFSADRNHIHHYLLDLGLNHKMTTVVCVTTNILFIAVAYFFRSLGTTMVFAVLTMVAVLLVGIVYYKRSKLKFVTISTPKKEKIIRSHKILTLARERIQQD